MSFLTVNQVSELLGLNIQTVYRKIWRGEISITRIGKSIRINDEQFGGSPKPNRPPQKLPQFLEDLFWDYDFATLESTNQIVLERILEFGDVGAVYWLKRTVAPQAIQTYLKKLGRKRLTPKSYFFWARRYGIEIKLEVPTQNSKRSLGQGRWR